jgi:hypothetical protein
MNLSFVKSASERVKAILESAATPLTAVEIAKMAKLETRHVNRILPSIRPMYGPRWAQLKKDRRLLFAVDEAANQLPAKARVAETLKTLVDPVAVIEQANKEWQGWGPPPVPSEPQIAIQEADVVFDDV